MPEKKRLRVVLDANLYGSILLGGLTRERFITLTRHVDDLDVCYSDELIAEIARFPAIAYFKKRGITPDVVRTFLLYLTSFAVKINVSAQVKLSRDPKDNYLLSLCRDGKIAYLLSGDNDLLTIGQYATTQIMPLAVFMERLPALLDAAQ